jgi:hypothetical protein
MQIAILSSIKQYPAYMRQLHCGLGGPDVMVRRSKSKGHLAQMTMTDKKFAVLAIAAAAVLILLIPSLLRAGVTQCGLSADGSSDTCCNTTGQCLEAFGSVSSAATATALPRAPSPARGIPVST